MESDPDVVFADHQQVEVKVNDEESTTRSSGKRVLRDSLVGLRSARNTNQKLRLDDIKV